MKNKKSIVVQGAEITILNIDNKDYISLSDMVSNFDGKNSLIEQWLRNKDTIEFLGIWEKINNENFNSLEFEGIKNQAGTNRFYLSIKNWVDKTNAQGILATAGRYGGTFAHQDIAFEFGTWFSPEFKLYLIKEFQRLKEIENQKYISGWNLYRTLSKINYRIHTDSIKDNLIPQLIDLKKINTIYSNEADLLNIAMFGMTAMEWRKLNPTLEGNMRDYSTIEQLLVLANLESLNAEFIRMNLNQQERLQKLNKAAINQMKSLLNSNKNYRNLLK